MQDLKEIKKELLKLGIKTRGMSDSRILDEATFNGLDITPQEQPQEQPQPQPQQQDDKPMNNDNATKKAIDALIETLTPANTGLDKQQVIDLINIHSPVTTTEILNVETKARENIGVTHACFDVSLAYIASGMDIYFHGDTGSGKSTTAKIIAKALDKPFFSMGALITKFEILGSNHPTNGYIPSVIYNWLSSENGGVLCFDEIDGSSPNALTTVMALFDQGGQMTFPNNKTLTRTDKHIVVTTANTIGKGATAQYNGRIKLDDAFLSRFVMVEHGYDENIENSFGGKDIADYSRKFRNEVKSKRLNGATITPRTILQASKVLSTNVSAEMKRKMLTNIYKQGLSTVDYKVITDNIGLAI